MDIRYINSVIITRLEQIDKKLYEEYILKFPYRTGIITHIDFEALVIEQMKCRMTREDVIKEYAKYGVTSRTLSRRISQMEKTNPYLYDIYKKYAMLNSNSSNRHIDSIELFSQISNLESKQVVLGERTDEREKELIELEKKYLELKSQGLNNKETCENLGMSFPVLYKKMRDLDRIRKERKARNNIEL